MIEFHRLWIEQCDAAYAIKERFGNEKALGYLIGEKLMNFVRSADTRTEFAQELPEFVATINAIFKPEEIREYLDNVHRVGVFGHLGRCSSRSPSIPVAEYRQWQCGTCAP